MAHIIRIGFYIQGLDDCFLFSPHYWTGFYSEKLNLDIASRGRHSFRNFLIFTLDGVFGFSYWTTTQARLHKLARLFGSYVQRLVRLHPPANSSRHIYC